MIPYVFMYPLSFFASMWYLQNFLCELSSFYVNLTQVRIFWKNEQLRKCPYKIDLRPNLCFIFFMFDMAYSTGGGASCG